MPFGWLESIRSLWSGLPLSFTAGVVFVIGLAVGSFLNVCIYRWPQQKLSVIKPRSFCPECKATIRWFDNIPVISFLLLRGKCRDCQKPIAIRYPVVELLSAVSIWLLYLSHGLTAVFFFQVCFIGLLLIATVTDLRERIIPDEVSFYGIVFALLMSYAFPVLQHETDHRLGIADSVLGALVGGGLLYAVAVVGDFIYKRESMGGGDIKLLAMIGAFVGVGQVFLTILVASFLGAAVGIVLKLVKRAEVIAFGPFLALGGVVSILWGGVIVRWMFPTF